MTDAGIRVWLSTHGGVVEPEQATISIFDRGFLYGDSVYETMRTAGGRVVELEAHIDRLRHSAAGIAFDVPFSDAQMCEAIAATLGAADNQESRLRLVVTRGTGPISLDTRVAEAPVFAVIVTPLKLLAPEVYAKGISALIIPEREGTFRPGLKTGNYLGHILALHRAHEEGAEDAILCNANGAIAEGASSNLFMVVDGTVHTPSLATGVLAGITRGLVIRLLDRELDAPVCARTVMPIEIRNADELFLTSSVRGVMPVTTLDGEPVGNGRPGPVTTRLIGAYERYLQRVAAEPGQPGPEPGQPGPESSGS